MPAPSEYPDELQADALDMVELLISDEGLSQNASCEAVGNLLGVSGRTLVNWGASHGHPVPAMRTDGSDPRRVRRRQPGGIAEAAEQRAAAQLAIFYATEALRILADRLAEGEDGKLGTDEVRARDARTVEALTRTLERASKLDHWLVMVGAAGVPLPGEQETPLDDADGDDDGEPVPMGENVRSFREAAERINEQLANGG